MAPNCSDPNRRRMIQYLSRVSAAETSLALMERGIQGGNVELIKNSVGILTKAFGNNPSKFDEAERETLADTFQKLVNLPSVETQISRRGQTCSPEDCQTCFWYGICSAEETQQIIAQSKDAFRRLKAADEAETARYRSRVAF